MTRPARRRLDRALVERGLATSRARAVELVETGRVTVAGAVADRPSRLVSPAEPIELLLPPARFVSRGGEKLAAALERFALDLHVARALDVGASTGGFTDCLLQAGAASVVAVDVGRGQLHQRLRGDDRVVLHEGVDVREVTTDLLGGSPVDVVTADLSFISLRLAVPALTGGIAVPGAPLVLLVKPQFEAGRAEASRGKGVIRDPAVHRRTLAEVAGTLDAAGAAIMGAMPSPLTGQAGNVEFFLLARTPTDEEETPITSYESMVDAAVAEAHDR